MATPYRALGKDAYISFQGTLISADYRSFEVELTLDVIDKSAGSDTHRSYLPTLQNGTAKLTYAYSGTAGSAYTGLLRVGQSGVLLWGPEGNAPGKPKGGANALVIAHSRPLSYNDLITHSVQFQLNGPLLFDDLSDVW
jgi:hypothetical protein